MCRNISLMTSCYMLIGFYFHFHHHKHGDCVFHSFFFFFLAADGAFVQTYLRDFGNRTVSHRDVIAESLVKKKLTHRFYLQNNRVFKTERTTLTNESAAAGSAKQHPDLSLACKPIKIVIKIVLLLYSSSK